MTYINELAASVDATARKSTVWQTLTKTKDKTLAKSKERDKLKIFRKRAEVKQIIL
jgi:hypothetical protein